MQRLCTTADIIEAQLLSDLLRQDGIEVHVFNQYALGALGEIPFTHAYPELWLADTSQHARAAAIVQAVRLQATSASFKPCGTCGEQIEANLLSCWNCGAPILAIE